MCSAIQVIGDTRCVITISWSAASTGSMAAEFVRTGAMAEDGVTPAVTHADIVTVRFAPERPVMLLRATRQPGTLHRVRCTRREQ